MLFCGLKKRSLQDQCAVCQNGHFCGNLFFENSSIYYVLVYSILIFTLGTP